MKDVIFDFKGKNYIVLGASSGMGRQIALDLAEAGANVLAVARNRERLEKVMKESDTNISIACLDVMSASSDEWDKVFSDFVSQHGKINGGVYTAGLTGCTPLKAYDEKLARDLVDVSVFGGVKFMQFASKKKYSEVGAAYIIFSSVAAYEGPKGILFYAASKGAVLSAVRVMSKEISHRKQRINSISPGWIQTEMTTSYLKDVGIGEADVHAGPLGIGNVQDVSSVALFLLSDGSKWITGQDFVVDGGYLNAR